LVGGAGECAKVSEEHNVSGSGAFAIDHWFGASDPASDCSGDELAAASWRSGITRLCAAIAEDFDGVAIGPG